MIELKRQLIKWTSVRFLKLGQFVVIHHSSVYLESRSSFKIDIKLLFWLITFCCQFTSYWVQALSAVGGTCIKMKLKHGFPKPRLRPIKRSLFEKDGITIWALDSLIGNLSLHFSKNWLVRFKNSSVVHTSNTWWQAFYLIQRLRSNDIETSLTPQLSLFRLRGTA